MDVVAHQKDRRAGCLQLGQTAETFLLELGVADGEEGGDGVGVGEAPAQALFPLSIRSSRQTIASSLCVFWRECAQNDELYRRPPRKKVERRRGGNECRIIQWELFNARRNAGKRNRA